MSQCNENTAISCAVWQIKDPAIDLSLLTPVLDTYKDKPGNLIIILQQAQDLYGYLPIDLLAYIAHECHIKPAKVLGVASFYTQFRLTPVGKNLVLLCQGTACHVNNAGEIETALQEVLDVAEGAITEDGLFTYHNVACIGCCSLSPVMMIGADTYGSLTPQKTKEIIKQIRAQELLAVKA